MSGTKYTLEQEKYLREYYPDHPTTDVAKHIGKSISSVHGKANKMGLRKSNEYLNSELSGIIRAGSPIGVEFRFKKGRTPENKGCKIPADVYEKIKPTMFKKGNLPHNARSDGEISHIRDKTGRVYKRVRVGANKWELLHRHTWEAANGKVPSGYIVVFKNGNTLDCGLDNLEIITRAENAIRNSIHKYPPEIKEAIRAVNKFKRKIKEVEDEEHCRIA